MHLSDMKPAVGQDKADKDKGLWMKRHSLQIIGVRTLSRQDGIRKKGVGSRETQVALGVSKDSKDLKYH